MVMESEKIIELTEEEAFCFSCNSQVTCFNECCRDLNQFLTPYDIVRLKNHFKLSSSDFLKQYTTVHVGPQTGLPVITITPADRFKRICPFVTLSGCSVYKDRPSSCRMYPLIRVLSRSRESRKKDVRYALLKESHCHGFNQNCRVTVKDWISGQGLGSYNEMNDLMMDIISLKNECMPGPLTGGAERLFYTMCYDIDHLREFGRVEGFEKLELPDTVKNDDTALLRFGMSYLKNYFREHLSIRQASD